LEKNDGNNSPSDEKFSNFIDNSNMEMRQSFGKKDDFR